MRYLLKNKAFGLIEVLIATVIVSIGVLGIAILQQKSMLLARSSENYSIAAMLATEMSNRIQSNPSEIVKGNSPNNFYINSHSTASPVTPFFLNSDPTDITDNTSGLIGVFTTTTKNYCYPTSLPATLCASTNGLLAATDLHEWMTLVQNSLPNGKGIVCLDSAVPPTSGLACDNINVGSGGSGGIPNSMVYIIKIRWTDTSGNNRIFLTQVPVFW